MFLIHRLTARLPIIGLLGFFGLSSGLILLFLQRQHPHLIAKARCMHRMDTHLILRLLRPSSFFFGVILAWWHDS